LIITPAVTLTASKAGPRAMLVTIIVSSSPVKISPTKDTFSSIAVAVLLATSSRVSPVIRATGIAVPPGVGSPPPPSNVYHT